MTSKLTITDERIEKIAVWLATESHSLNLEMLTCLRELQERRKAAMDSKPVAEVVSVFGDSESIGERELKLLVGIQNMPYGTKFYRHAQPAPDTEREPIAWLNDAYLARGVVDGEAGSEDAGPGYIPVYREASPAQPVPVVPDDVQRDAKRWRALLGSARIRILGSAGFDATAHPGENPDYRHFGMEIWTHYPNWLHEKNEYGIDTLTQYADAMLAAAPQEVKSES